jgi:hypothetical protein
MEDSLTIKSIAEYPPTEDELVNQRLITDYFFVLERKKGRAPKTLLSNGRASIRMEAILDVLSLYGELPIAALVLDRGFCGGLITGYNLKALQRLCRLGYLKLQRRNRVWHVGEFITF